MAQSLATAGTLYIGERYSHPHLRNQLIVNNVGVAPVLLVGGWNFANSQYYAICGEVRFEPTGAIEVEERYSH